MATTVNLRQILDRKVWEMCNCSLNPQGIFSSFPAVAVSSLFDGFQMWIDNSSSICTPWLYDPRQDAAIALAASGQTVQSSSDGMSVAYHPSGPTGTATAGTSNTITTALTLPGTVAGYNIRITGGTGAGQELTIASNTYGANAVITTTTNWSVTPDNTSVFLLLTGRFWVFNSQTTASFRVYDLALGTWTTKSASGITTAVQSRLVSTPAYGNSTTTVATATAGASTTLTNSAKTWTTNQWANYQVRLIAGTGAGQVRTVASNTGTVLTVSSAWTTNPDSTSTYVIEPNDDFLYVVFSGVVAMYRYSISGDAWTLLSPGVARTGAFNLGGSLNWVGVASDSSWANESAIKNGRYIYSFQGGASQNVSYYDIAANTWINVTTGYRNSGGSTGTDFGPATGWGSCSDREFIYFNRALQSGSQTPFYRFNCVTQVLEPFTVFPIPYSGNLPQGQRLIIGSYTDGGTTLRWLYFLPQQQSGTQNAPLYRMLII